MAVDSFELKGKSEVPQDAHTVFVFSLPFAIPVPDGIYPVKIGTHTAEISVKRVKRKNRRF